MKRIIKKNNQKEIEEIIEKLSTSKKDFVVSKTNYTTTIKTNKSKIMFNPEGKSDTNGLYLINKSRRDAKEFLKENKIETIKTGNVNWYLYNDMNGRKRPKGDCIKLDLNSAYWAAAQKMGVIKEETIEMFERMSSDKSKSEKKQLRLKALGSLATIKKTEIYEKGEITGEKREPYDTELRNLYIAICKEVDKELMGIMRKYGLLYYYWDMVMINEKSVMKNVKNDIKELGYEFKIKADIYEIFKSSYLNFIYTYKERIKYPIRKSDIL